MPLLIGTAYRVERPAFKRFFSMNRTASVSEKWVFPLIKYIVVRVGEISVQNRKLRALHEDTVPCSLRVVSTAWIGWCLPCTVLSRDRFDLELVVVCIRTCRSTGSSIFLPTGCSDDVKGHVGTEVTLRPPMVTRTDDPSVGLNFQREHCKVECARHHDRLLRCFWANQGVGLVGGDGTFREHERLYPRMM